MPSIASAYRGPLVIIGLGGGFSVVGAVPVAITFSIGVKTSATIIGMGFVGFGFLLILPGLFWCIMVRTHSFKFWRRRRRANRRREDEEEEEEETPALNSSSNKPDKDIQINNATRERRWPPVYVEAPSLIITAADSRHADNNVLLCKRQSSLSNDVSEEPAECRKRSTDDDDDEAAEETRTMETETTETENPAITVCQTDATTTQVTYCSSTASEVTSSPADPINCKESADLSV